MTRVAIAISVLFMAGHAIAQPSVTPGAPPMIIEPADADAFREIIETTVPPRYNGALIRWYMAILQRQQAKAAEEKEREEATKQKSP